MYSISVEIPSKHTDTHNNKKHWELSLTVGATCVTTPLSWVSYLSQRHHKPKEDEETWMKMRETKVKRYKQYRSDNHA